MSILPLFGPKLALGFYSSSYAVTDYEYETTDGEDSRVAYGSRTSFVAAIDPSNSRRLEMIFGGNVSDGDIGIYTEAELYIADIYTPGTSPKQSFVTYQGFIYRVVEVADWMGQAGVRVYLGRRHVAQD